MHRAMRNSLAVALAFAGSFALAAWRHQTALLLAPGALFALVTLAIGAVQSRK
jgi:hypothetical protein